MRGVACYYYTLSNEIAPVTLPDVFGISANISRRFRCVYNAECRSSLYIAGSSGFFMSFEYND